jgi:hypothetical protein
MSIANCIGSKPEETGRGMAVANRLKIRAIFRATEMLDK